MDKHLVHEKKQASLPFYIAETGSQHWFCRTRHSVWTWGDFYEGPTAANWKCYFFVIRMIHITFIPSETPHWNAKAANTNRIFIFPSTCFFTWKRFVKSIQTPFQSISSFLQLFCDFSAGKLTYMPIHARTVFSAETWKILKPVRHY